MGGLSGIMGQGGKGGASGNTEADVHFTNEMLGQNEEAITNRYKQLGIGVAPGLSHSGPIADATFDKVAYGGTPGHPTAATSPTSFFSYDKPSTMEGEDIGTVASRQGGQIGAAHALLGELFDPNRAAGLGPGGPLEQLAQQNQQQEQAGFAAGSGGGQAGGLGGLGGFGQASGQFGGG